MIRFRFIKVGKPAFSEYENLVSTYIKRINHFVDCSYQVIKDNDPKQTTARVLEFIHGPSSKGRTKNAPWLVCLDESGELISSVSLSTKLRLQIEGSKDVVFLIGGPYGIDSEILSAAHWRWGLSRSTLTSDMAWLIATEQVYRAMTILNNQPYHHL